MVSLETRDYAEAVQRAREILDSPELQPAQTLPAEVERFLKHKVDTNRYSKMSAESKRSCLTMFADSVKNVPPTNVTGYHCKAFYLALKKRIAPSTAESYMFTLRSFFNWCVRENLCRRNPQSGAPKVIKERNLRCTSQELDHNPPAKDHRNGSPARSALIRCFQQTPPPGLRVRASRSSQVRAPHGIPIRSARPHRDRRLRTRSARGRPDRGNPSRRCCAV